ncbi:MAG: hypothetical protein HY235_04440 [Acidobacteria bacterium]|nr:hypothetical protein [Acidobacteriota bacterium]
MIRKIRTRILLSCQMTWATIAHVSNDWLAEPVAVWTLVALISYGASPRWREPAWMRGRSLKRRCR